MEITPFSSENNRYICFFTLTKFNGDFSILFKKEWRFLHSFWKRMEITPFCWVKIAEFVF